MNDEVLVTFGIHLRTLRLKQKLSQEQLAELANVHRTYIGMLERGEKNVTLKTIMKLANALEIPPYELLKF